METKVYNEMDYNELDDLVNGYFPKADFNFVADEEMHNDSEKSLGEIKKENFDLWSTYDCKDFEEIILGKKAPSFRSRLFVEFFVGHGLLPEGNYLIKVSW